MGFVIEIVLGIIALGSALFIVGRHEAEMGLPVVAMVAAGIALTTLLLTLLAGFAGLGIAFVIATWAIHQFCYLGWGKAAAAALLYIVFRIGIGFLFSWLGSVMM